MHGQRYEKKVRNVSPSRFYKEKVPCGQIMWGHAFISIAFSVISPNLFLCINGCRRSDLSPEFPVFDWFAGEIVHPRYLRLKDLQDPGVSIFYVFLCG